MPAKNQKKRRTRLTPARTSEVLDVRMAAELLLAMRYKLTLSEVIERYLSVAEEPKT
jgi:hypothetical protein